MFHPHPQYCNKGVSRNKGVYSVHSVSTFIDVVPFISRDKQWPLSSIAFSSVTTPRTSSIHLLFMSELQRASGPALTWAIWPLSMQRAKPLVVTILPGWCGYSPVSGIHFHQGLLVLLSFIPLGHLVQTFISAYIFLTRRSTVRALHKINLDAERRCRELFIALI